MGQLPLSSIKVIMLLDNPFVSDARVEKEAVALIEHGAIVTVWCEKSDSLPINDDRNGIAISRCVDPILYSPFKKGYQAVLASLVHQLIQQDFSVLHCHDFHMLAIGAEVKKRNNNVQLIYDAHEFLVGWPFYQTAGDWKNRFKGWIVWNYLKVRERRNIKIADAVITVTNGISNRLKSNNELKETPTVLGNYPELLNRNMNKSYFHDKYNLKSDVRVLVHSGTIYHTDSQLKELFEIIVDLPNAILVFIGNRPRFFELKNKVQLNAVLSTRIFFHDYELKQSDNINLIASADIGLMHIRDRWLSHKITFSNRFVEYIMAGIPVVATPQEFTKELNNQFNCCTFYSENDTEQLKQGLLKVLDNLEVYTVNADKARNQLDWKKESGKLTELYLSLSQNYIF
jgi:glycosyltransferase involved in cell wall biosynthesis